MEEKIRQQIIERIQLVRNLEGTRIPFKTGRPDRTEKINYDDTINLRILLNTVKSLDEFIFNC